MDKKNWLMAAVAVGALVLAFTVVPALADDAGEIASDPADWTDMAEHCLADGDYADHELLHQEHMDSGVHPEGCPMTDGAGWHGDGIKGHAKIDKGTMRGMMPW